MSVLLLVSCLSFGAYAASCNTYDLDEVVEFLQSNYIYPEAMSDDGSCVINLVAERIDIKGSG